MRKVLITGGAGFVGRHFVRRWLESGADVHVVDPIAPLTGGIDPDRGWPLFEPRDFAAFHFHREDCRTYFARAADTEFDYAFHLAAMVGGRLMIERNPLVVADDLSIDAAYWQWAVRARPRKTACFSSSAAYPIKYQREHGYVLLEESMIDFEDDLGMPDMSYGWAKLTCEYLARLAHARHGLKSVCYRPFSGYGEDQDDTYPFPGIVKRVLGQRGAARLTVWGSGRQMRDFIHIDDCVEGVRRTMDAIDDGGALNLSTGRLTSFIEFAGTAARLAGYTPEIAGMSDYPEGVFARGGDTKKQRALDVVPRVSFEEGIRRGLDYYERNDSRPPRVHHG